MDERDQVWTEADSALYRALGAVAVPARAEQIATLLTLIPFGRDESFHAVELGAGEGRLAFALLDAFPHATITALDRSATMRAIATHRLQAFDARARIAPFELTSHEWWPHLAGADCALASLCLHHLPGVGKREVFAAIATRLSRRGALLIADLVTTRRPEGRELFAATWDRAAEEQALAHDGSLEAFAAFVTARWNYYRFPDPFDQPSSLVDQLRWLEEAGFAMVEPFWLRAGHAIFGGYQTTANINGDPLSFALALRSAQAALTAG